MVAVFLPLLMCSHAMTQEEAYIQVSQSSSLLKAVLNYVRKKS